MNFSRSVRVPSIIAASFLVPSLMMAATTTFVLAYRPVEILEPIDTASGYQKAGRFIQSHLENLGAKFEIDILSHEMLVRVRDASPDMLAQIRRELGRPGRIEFCQVHVDSPGRPDTGIAPPTGYRTLLIEYPEDTGMPPELLWVAKLPAMTSRSIQDAVVVPNSVGSFQIIVHLSKDGRKRFHSLTKEMADKPARDGRPRRLAILLNGALITAPGVTQAIDQDSVEIAGRFTEREALELCNYLNTPIDLPSLVEERSN